MRNVFIAYDFSCGGTLPTDLQTLSSYPPPGVEVHWPGHQRLENPGGLWEQKLKPGIDSCDRLVAFADLPNANVGFEIGYALSREKEIGVAHIRPRPHRWLKNPPFRGEFIQRLEDVDEIGKFLDLDNWPTTRHSVGSEGQSILFLCPKKSGAAFRKFNPDGWELPDRDRWDLRSFSRTFEDVGLVVWVIAPHNEGESGRDGSENAALSILAGFAEGHPGLDLIVLRSHDAREVADVASHDHCFESIDQFRNLLLLIEAGWAAPDRAANVKFRDWLPALVQTPAFGTVDLVCDKPGNPVKDPLILARQSTHFTEEVISKRPSRLIKFAIVMMILALGSIASAVLSYLGKDARIVYEEDIQEGTVVRLRADNFETTATLEATAGELGSLKIEIPDFKIRDEYKDTDKAPKVFLEVVKPEHLVFEHYAWSENENYRSKEPLALPYARNRIGSRLITRGQWDHNRFKQATNEVSRQLPGLEPEAWEDLFEALLKQSNLSLEDLKKSVAEKSMQTGSGMAAIHKFDHGKIIEPPSEQSKTQPLTATEKEALTAVVASTGALFVTSAGSNNYQLSASGLVVGEHFVFTSPKVLPDGFVPEKLPAMLPDGKMLAFSLSETVGAGADLLPVQDVVAIASDYVVLMVPGAGRVVQSNLERYYPSKKVKTMLANEFVFISPDAPDSKCVAIGYPVADDATPSQIQKLLAMPTNSGFRSNKRVSVGRVYTSNPVWSTHTATTMNGAQGGPVALVNDREVGIMGFSGRGMWLGEGHQLNATFRPGYTGIGNQKAKDLVKLHIIADATKEIRHLPGIMKQDEEIWLSYFSTRASTYQLRKKLAELRSTLRAFRVSGNDERSYQAFRSGWINFRSGTRQNREPYRKAIGNFERLLRNDPQYYLAWLRLGEAYDKNLERIKAYETLKKGLRIFEHQSGPLGKSNLDREIEASFLNTLFLVCKILSGHEENQQEFGQYSPAQFEAEANKYFNLLRSICPYHPTLIGPER